MPRDETKDEDDSSDGDGPEFVDMIAACKDYFGEPDALPLLERCGIRLWAGRLLQ